MLKITHTSDLQLDARFRFLGKKGPETRRLLRETFRRIVDLAIEAKDDLVLIAGDLFDSNRPQQDTLEYVALQLERLHIPVCILPGNHDCYDASSVYRRAQFPDNVVVFAQRPTIQVFHDLDVTVHGNPILSNGSRDGPLSGLTRTGSTRWHIAMAHGNMVRPDISDPPRPIQPGEIAASGMDYVALGDWHAYADQSSGNVTAFYSGAPMPIAFSQKGAGFVAHVEMDESGVRVQPRQVGALAASEISADVSGQSTASLVETLVEALRARANQQLMLKVTLSGLLGLGTVLDTEALEQELAPHFYHIQCSDQSLPQVAESTIEDYGKDTVIGRFIRLMQRRTEGATDDAERRRAERALQLGVALLQGKKVL